MDTVSIPVNQIGRRLIMLPLGVGIDSYLDCCCLLQVIQALVEHCSLGLELLDLLIVLGYQILKVISTLCVLFLEV